MTGLGRNLFVTVLAMTVVACAKAPIAVATEPERDALAASLMRDISVLASDEFGGRQPGTDGERLTVNYICLLYTSPSPRDQRGSRMPSSA